MKSVINNLAYYSNDSSSGASLKNGNSNKHGNKSIPQTIIQILQENVHLEKIDEDSKNLSSGKDFDDSNRGDSAPSEANYDIDSGEENEEPDEKTNFPDRSEKEFERSSFNRKSLGDIDYLEEDDEININAMKLHKKYNQLPSYIKKAFYDNIENFFEQFKYSFDEFIKKPLSERYFFLPPLSQKDFAKSAGLNEDFLSTAAVRYYININGIRYNIDDLFDQKTSISINTFALSLYILENFENLEELNDNKTAEKFNMNKTAAYLADKLKKDRNIDLCIADTEAAFVKSVKSAFDNALKRQDYFYHNYIERYFV